jgi:hypothetical protein
MLAQMLADPVYFPTEKKLIHRHFLSDISANSIYSPLPPKPDSVIRPSRVQSRERVPTMLPMIAHVCTGSTLFLSHFFERFKRKSRRHDMVLHRNVEG